MDNEHSKWTALVCLIWLHFLCVLEPFLRKLSHPPENHWRDNSTTQQMGDVLLSRLSAMKPSCTERLVLSFSAECNQTETEQLERDSADPWQNSFPCRWTPPICVVLIVFNQIWHHDNFPRNTTVSYESTKLGTLQRVNSDSHSWFTTCTEFKWCLLLCGEGLIPWGASDSENPVLWFLEIKTKQGVV